MPARQYATQRNPLVLGWWLPWAYMPEVLAPLGGIGTALTAIDDASSPPQMVGRMNWDTLENDATRLVDSNGSIMLCISNSP